MKWKRRLVFSSTYCDEGCGTEAGSEVEPVIFAKFVNFDALFIRLMRHRLCHHQRLGAHLRFEVGTQIGSDLQMLFEG